MNIDERVYGYEPAASQLKELRSEIEWLKTDMRQAAKLNMELMEIRRNNEAEIARLNTLIEEMQVVNAMLPEIVIEERDEARNEVKRLRDQVVRLSTLVDTERSLHDTEIERLREAYKTDLAETLAEKVKLETEIERLRKELAEKDDYIRTVSRPIGAHSYE